MRACVCAWCAARACVCVRVLARAAPGQMFCVSWRAAAGAGPVEAPARWLPRMNCCVPLAAALMPACARCVGAAPAGARRNTRFPKARALSSSPREKIGDGVRRWVAAGAGTRANGGKRVCARVRGHELTTDRDAAAVLSSKTGTRVPCDLSTAAAATRGMVCAVPRGDECKVWFSTPDYVHVAAVDPEGARFTPVCRARDCRRRSPRPPTPLPARRRSRRSPPATLPMTSCRGT